MAIRSLSSHHVQVRMADLKVFSTSVMPQNPGVIFVFFLNSAQYYALARSIICTVRAHCACCRAHCVRAGCFVASTLSAVVVHSVATLPHQPGPIATQNPRSRQPNNHLAANPVTTDNSLSRQRSSVAPTQY